MVFDLLAKDAGKTEAEMLKKQAQEKKPDFNLGHANLLSIELANKRSLQVRYDETNKGFSVQGLTWKQCRGKAQV